MTSIRRYLLLGMLGALILAGVGAAVGVYTQTLQEANALFDYQLKQVALALRDHAATAVAVAGGDQSNEEQEVVIQIWDNAGLHLYHSRQGHVSLPRAGPGWTVVTTAHGAWRVFTLVENDRTIQVEQPVHVRRVRAAGMAARVLFPWLLVMPLLGGLIWWLVGRGLQPLTTIAHALSARTPQALDPLPTVGLPQEVQPLVTAMNDLLQRLATALTAQQAFIADAAHTLRTPLTAVALQAQIASRVTHDEERHQALATLQQGVQRATHMVQQLLTLARTDATATQRSLVPIEINPLLHAVIVDHAPLAADKAIDLGLARADPARIMGEPESLRLLFGNLLENAIRYTPMGGTVDVQIISAPNTIDVVVMDTGPGIPPEDHERVFDRFYRRADTDVPGSGLGLAIVKAIVERHHAQVTLDARDNSTGLVVHVTFSRL